MTEQEPEREREAEAGSVPPQAREYMDRLAERHAKFHPAQRDTLIERLEDPPEQVIHYILRIEALGLRWSEKRTREVVSVLGEYSNSNSGSGSSTGAGAGAGSVDDS